MGSILSRIVIEDENIGRSRWLLKKGTWMIPPGWWASVVTFQLPLWSTIIMLFKTPVKNNKIMVWGDITLLGLTLYFQVLTVLSDPGIVARGSQDDLKLPPNHTAIVETGERSEVYRWCSVCQLHRPPRTYHCYTIDCCVQEYDHFCPAVGACIGKRTLGYFIGYLTSSGLLSTFHGMNTLYFYITMPKERHSELSTMCATASTSCGAGFWSLVMSGYYFYLICMESTKREDIKGLPNPNAVDSPTLRYRCSVLWNTLFGALPISILQEQREKQLHMQRNGLESHGQIFEPAAS